MRLLVFGNPENRRITFLRQAAETCGWEMRVVAYEDLLNGRIDLENIASGIDAARIDSPGENFDVERLLLARGAPLAAAKGAAHLPVDRVRALTEELGRIHFPWQYFLGFESLLQELDNRLPGVPWMNSPAAVASMFDKLQTNRIFHSQGIPIPAQLGVVESFEHLQELIGKSGHQRLFLKLAASSSASGAMALFKHKQLWRGVTTVEMERDSAGCRLYNSLRLRVLRKQEDVAEWVEALTPHRLFAEAWLPKAAYDHRTTFDLRVVVINGEPTHFVPRVSSSPMTNLHLGNRRGNFESVREKLGDRFAQLELFCSQAAKAIPGCFHSGLDVVVDPTYRKFTVLEANACGDLLPGATDQYGRDTFSAELQSLIP